MSTTLFNEIRNNKFMNNRYSYDYQTQALNFHKPIYRNEYVLISFIPSSTYNFNKQVYKHSWELKEFLDNTDKKDYAYYDNENRKFISIARKYNIKGFKQMTNLQKIKSFMMYVDF